jgi:hypothetical protein
MKLVGDNKDIVLKEFPKFELSYEKNVHKKVYDCELSIAVPDGIRAFAWFTTYKKENVCFILEMDYNGHLGYHDQDNIQTNKIRNIYSVICGFDDKLAYGSIFYGVVFKYKDNNYFSIEDIYFYQGQDLSKQNYFYKLSLLKSILANQLSQYALNNKFIIFGLPLIMNNFTHLLREIEVLPYKINYIKFRSFKQTHTNLVYVMHYVKRNYNNENINNNKNFPRHGIFKVTPDIQNDIYNLFVYGNGKEEFYDIAFIPDYKTSVMMNKLFRNIKENQNLDALEESDGEEEFEDERVDKYVYLDRSFKMICEYNNKFKKWVPINLADKKDRLITSNMLSIKNSKS